MVDFLVSTMVDLGAGTHPAFFDYNGDGLYDLVVGNFTLFGGPGQRDASLFLFENVGTATSPAFRLVDEDYLEMGRFTPEGYNFSPAFGDIDGFDTGLLGDTYSWNSGIVIVPAYDSEAESEGTEIDANLALEADGVRIISWYVQ